jgi:hypothetical protein
MKKIANLASISAVFAILLIFATLLYFTEISPAYADASLTATPTTITVTPRAPRAQTSEAGTSDGILTLGLLIVTIILTGTLWPRKPIPTK